MLDGSLVSGYIGNAMASNSTHTLLDVGFDAYEKSKGVMVSLNREISKQEVFTAIDGMVDYSFIERINKNTLLIRVEEKNFSS